MAAGKYDNPKYVAQDILSRRDHSEHEMRTKLARKGFLGPDIDETISWLYEQKLLDDAAYARRYTESVLRTKPVGPQYLLQKLRQRGVEKSLANDAVRRWYELNSETALAREAASGWQRAHPKHKHDRVRIARFLASRGFSQDVVWDVIDSVVA